MMQIKYYFINKQVENRAVIVDYVCIVDIVIDRLTKPLDTIKF